MRKLAVIALMTLAGCSHEYDWQKSGAGNGPGSQASKDDYECRKEGYAVAGVAGNADGPNAVAGRDQYKRCMAARGYVDKNS